MINQKYKEQFDKIQKEFQSAENKIKQLELMDKNISIPAINELRYVAYHLLTAGQNSSSDETTIEELKKATRHTRRAYYDAIEAMLLFLLNRLENFDKVYNTIPETIEVIPDYTDKRAKIFDIVEKIEEINTDTKDKKYLEIESYYEEIKTIDMQFESSIPSIASLSYKNEQKDKKEQRKFVLLFLVGVIGVFVAITGIIIS